MKRFLKGTLKFVVIVFCAGWLYTKLFWPSTFTDAPEILANLYAKELCTCRFVIGQSLERCYENHANIMKPTTLEIDEAAKTVHVRVLWAVADARVVSERFGCSRE